MLTVTVNHRLGCQLFHHGLADLVACLAPNVHDVVVALLSGDKTRGVLLVDFLDLAAGFLKDIGLDPGDQHITHGNRDTAARGEAKA